MSLGEVRIESTGGTAETNTLLTTKVNQVGSRWFQTSDWEIKTYQWKNPQELAIKLRKLGLWICGMSVKLQIGCNLQSNCS